MRGVSISFSFTFDVELVRVLASAANATSTCERWFRVIRSRASIVDLQRRQACAGHVLLLKLSVSHACLAARDREVIVRELSFVNCVYQGLVFLAISSLMDVSASQAAMVSIILRNANVFLRCLVAMCVSSVDAGAVREF